MSKKNLARTAIEGGRHSSNKYERRKSHKYNRIEMKQYLNAVKLDPEHFDEEVEPETVHVYKEFTDKLNPMYRWLDAQVGRPWDEVRSEVFQKFDTRTTAGRHITFDHLLRSIVETNTGWNKYGYNLWDPDSRERTSFWRRPDYYVDENGILCRTKKEKSYFKYYYPNEEEQKIIAEWLAGRMIGEIDGKLYWFAPQEGAWNTLFMDSKNNSKYSYERFKVLKYCLWDFGEVKLHYWSETLKWWVEDKKMAWSWIPIENPFSFRQRAQLNEEELKFYNSIPYRIKLQILSYTKGRNGS